MRVQIESWGDSLILRIPEALAAEAHLEPGTTVEVSLVDGKLVLTPVDEPKYTLEQLLAGVTEENIHREVDWGPAMGNEVW
jgi:antitoxin MazE